jgi:plastocyanin
MKRILVLGSIVAIAATSFALVAAAATAPKRVVGTVGPGFTIGLKVDGKKVTRLRAGARYRFVVNDRSAAHNFRLTGPGVNRVITGVGQTGTRSIVVTLRRGTYRFVCDPHASSMRGSFRAT